MVFLMKIKQIHAHFLISIGNYSNERIGFTVEFDEENDSITQVIENLRLKAREAVGLSADELYSEKYAAESACREVQQRLAKLRTEWDATAEFLKAQGIKPDAPSMPQFNKLLEASKVEGETIVEGELDDAPF
jgi:hypothetical protein